MKKIIAIVLSIVFCLSLCSCSFLNINLSGLLNSLFGNEEPATPALNESLLLSVQDYNGNWSNYDENHPGIDGNIWEPGMVKMLNISITNVSDQSTRWIMNLDGEYSELAEILDVYVAYDRTSYPEGYDEATSFEYIGKLSSLVNGQKLQNGMVSTTVNVKLSGNLEAANQKTYEFDSTNVLIIVAMPLDAGNEYQGMSLGSNIHPTVSQMFFASVDINGIN